MAKRKAQTSARPRSATKTRSKVKRAKAIERHNRHGLLRPLSAVYARVLIAVHTHH